MSGNGARERIDWYALFHKYVEHVYDIEGSTHLANEYYDDTFFEGWTKDEIAEARKVGQEVERGE